MIYIVSGFNSIKLNPETIFLLFIGIAVIFLSFPHIAFVDQLTTITVKVEHNKANGKPWDNLKGQPDLAICLSNSLTGTLCLPEGDPN